MIETAKEIQSDLQEITFWHQLNKQLIRRRNLGESVTEENQKFLQEFCFNNQLFHRITEDPLIDEIPITLITDFDRITFLTFNIESWNKYLTSLSLNSICLDVEQALADAFDAMTELDKKYRVFETTPADIDADNDEELYAFIDEYNTIIEKQGREFSNALRFVNELKADVIGRISSECHEQASIIHEDNNVLLDFKHIDDRDRINSIYTYDFCDQAIAWVSKFIDATGVFQDMEIHGLLDNKESEPKLKPSIREFIEHERPLIEKQSKLIRQFNGQLKSKLDSKSDYRIKILNLSPFAFLKNPFPEV